MVDAQICAWPPRVNVRDVWWTGAGWMHQYIATQAQRQSQLTNYQSFFPALHTGRNGCLMEQSFWEEYSAAHGGLGI